MDKWPPMASTLRADAGLSELDASSCCAGTCCCSIHLHLLSQTPWELQRVGLRMVVAPLSLPARMRSCGWAEGAAGCCGTAGCWIGPPYTQTHGIYYINMLLSTRSRHVCRTRWHPYKISRSCRSEKCDVIADIRLWRLSCYLNVIEVLDIVPGGHHAGPDQTQL